MASLRGSESVTRGTSKSGSKIRLTKGMKLIGKIKTRLGVILICLFSLVLKLTPSLAQAESTTAPVEATSMVDRVVVAINNIPYTQLEIESYLNVKESLRDNADSSQVVNQANWSVALDAFLKDMMIHQEATKSSGFRPTKETIQKLRVRSEKITTTFPQFIEAFNRLKLTRDEVEREILRIATVENYRRGKASLLINAKNSHKGWEEELQSRSIIRLFDEAKTWKTLQQRL